MGQNWIPQKGQSWVPPMGTPDDGSKLGTPNWSKLGNPNGSTLGPTPQWVFRCVFYTRRRECCCSEALRRFRAGCKLEDGTLDIDHNAIKMLERSLSFTNHTVEMEHKSFSDLTASATAGADHGAAVTGNVCRRLRKFHMDQGGADPARSSTPMVAAAEPSEGLTYGELRAVECAKDKQSCAALSEAADLSELERKALQEAQASHRLLDEIYQQSPKTMYTNYITSQEKNRGVKRSRVEYAARVQELSKRFDETPRLQEAWKTLWEAAKRRKAQHQRSQPVAVPRARGREPAEGSHAAARRPIWPAVLQVPDQQSEMPIAPAVLARFFNSEWKVLSRWQDEEKALVTKAMVPSDCPDGTRVEHKFRELVGCPRALRNICLHDVADEVTFHQVRAGLNQILDENRDLAKRVELLLELRGTRFGARTAIKYVLVGEPVWNPKVQTLVRVLPTGRETDSNGFTTTLRAPPFELVMAKARSRLCLPAPAPAAFLALFHETSDEVCAQLADFEGHQRNWSGSILSHKIKTGTGDLLHMLVEGKGEAVPLRSKVKGSMPQDLVSSALGGAGSKDAENPVAAGRRRGLQQAGQHNPGSFAQVAGAAAAAGVAVEGETGVGDVGDHDVPEGPPPDGVGGTDGVDEPPEDVDEVIALGIDAVPAGLEEPAEVEPALDEAGADELRALDGAPVVEEDQDEPEPAALPPYMKDELGNISVLPPSYTQRVGRLFFSLSKSPGTIIATCYQHAPGCKQFFPLSKYGEEDAIAWILRGEAMADGATSDDKEAAAASHKVDL